VSFDINPQPFLDIVASEEEKVELDVSMGGFDDIKQTAHSITSNYYVRENTTYWLYKLSNREKWADLIDYVSDCIEIDVRRLVIVEIPPGTIQPIHRDHFEQHIRKMYPHEVRKPLKAQIQLQDWTPGWQFGIAPTERNIDKDWSIDTHWKAGDGWYFTHETYHLSCNASNQTKISLAAAGVPKRDLL
jgi:hypothetical protein